MSDIAKLEAMMFNYETVYRTDYRPNKITAPTKTVYKPKPKKPRPLPPPMKDIHTLCNWDKSVVPFDLMIHRKEILREDPHVLQEVYTKQEDPDLKVVQKTRPRLVMTPAVSMDDIEDENTRSLLLKDVYTTTVMKMNSQTVSPCNKVIGLKYPAPPHPIKLEKPHPCVVPPEWRFESCAWDGKQLRSYVDPGKEFWLNRPKK